MVARVYGTANGQEVIFTRTEGDAWEVSVPWEEDGEYLTEIYAEDEAGNATFLCRMLFAIAGHEMQAFIVGTDWQAAEVGPRFHAELQGGGFYIARAVCSGCTG